MFNLVLVNYNFHVVDMEYKLCDFNNKCTYHCARRNVELN